jgi:lipid-A-disaccharide synthase
MIRVFLIAGEPSGDRLGAALMAGLKTLTGGQVAFEGIGGPLMEAEGLTSLFPIEEIAIMGLTEILSQYPRLKRRIDQASDAVIAGAPDVLVTIDLPEFNLRVARQVKAAAPIRCVHYVAPSVWAWRSGRAEKMARHVDQVLALLPFEPPYMTEAWMECDFVGHPVVTEPVASPDEIAALRAEVGGATQLLVLPGSRRSEVGRLAPIFGAVLARLAPQIPDLRVIVPAAPSVAEAVRAEVARWEVPATLIDSADLARKRAAFGAADAALAASGTVSLELAAAGTPMVIAYDMAWLSRQIIGRMLKVDTVTLVNLVSETRAVPEFIGTRCRPEAIAPALQYVLAEPEAQRAAMARTMARLGRGDTPPGERAARAVLRGLGAAGH